jgi:PhnB protein
MNIDPYLNFNGRADEAIELYKSALGAKVNMLMRYKDSPEQCPGGFAPEILNKVMHASLSIGNSTIMISDGQCRPDGKFSGITLSLQVSSDAEAEQRFTALAEGGNVTMPLGKTFFASAFGMVTDRFGVSWMVIKQKQM